MAAAAADKSLMEICRDSSIPVPDDLKQVDYTDVNEAETILRVLQDGSRHYLIEVQQLPLMWAAHNEKTELAEELVKRGADVLKAMCAYVAWLSTAMVTPSRTPAGYQWWNIKAPLTMGEQVQKKGKVDNQQKAYTIFPMLSGNQVKIYAYSDNKDVHIQGHSFDIYVSRDSVKSVCVNINNLRYFKTPLTDEDKPVPTAKAILDIAYSFKKCLHESLQLRCNVKLSDHAVAGTLVAKEDGYTYMPGEKKETTSLSWSVLTCVAYGVPYYTYLTQEMNMKQPLLPMDKTHPFYKDSWWRDAVVEKTEIKEETELSEFQEKVKQWVQKLRAKHTASLDDLSLSTLHGKALEAVQKKYNTLTSPYDDSLKMTTDDRHLYNNPGKYIRTPRSYEVMLKF